MGMSFIFRNLSTTASETTLGNLLLLIFADQLGFRSARLQAGMGLIQEYPSAAAEGYAIDSDMSA